MGDFVEQLLRDKLEMPEATDIAVERAHSREGTQGTCS